MRIVHMMRRLRPSCVLLALLLAGCGAALPGYTPPTPASEKRAARLPTGGGVASDGHYVLNDQELKLDCKKLSGVVHVAILQLRESAQTPRRSIPAAVSEAVFSPVVGGARQGMDPENAIARTRARIVALNNRLAEKNCPTYDLDAELKPGNVAPPAPVKPSPKQ